MEVNLAIRHMRQHHLPQDTFFGKLELYTSSDDAFLEHLDARCHHHFWQLCSEMLWVDPKRFLVVTEATQEVLTQTMIDVMNKDGGLAATRLKWKPSRCGGRTIASPSQTANALAAGRRRTNKITSTMHSIAEVVVNGDTGHEDAEILKRIMDHACQAIGLHLCVAASPDNPKAGEYIHLASRDVVAPAGRLSVLLKVPNEVYRLYAALHGQALLVNGDYVEISVLNDKVRMEVAAGNDPRARR